METEKILSIEIPNGYEIDKEQSSFERIVFKKIGAGLPESWREFCSVTKRGGFFLNTQCDAQYVADSGTLSPTYDRNILESADDCEAHLALMQLHRLRDCYRQGWKPTSDDIGVSVFVDCHGVTREACTSRFLSFPNREIAAKFAVNFKDLLSTAKELLR